MKMVTVLFWQTKAVNLLLPCLLLACFFICKSMVFPVLSAIRQYAFTGRKLIFRHAKNRCILQTTPFPRHPSARLTLSPASLCKALYGLLTAESSFSVQVQLLLNFLTSPAKQWCSLACRFFIKCSLSDLPILFSLFNSHNGQKIGAASGLHLFFIAEINVI